MLIKPLFDFSQATRTAAVVTGLIFGPFQNQLFSQNSLPDPAPLSPPVVPNPYTPPTPSVPTSGEWTQPEEYSIGRVLSEYQSTQDEAKKTQLRTQLNTLIEKQFDRKLAWELQQVAGIQNQLERMQQLVNKRQALREKIVSDRVASLIQQTEGTGWESSLSAPSFPASSFPASSFPAPVTPAYPGTTIPNGRVIPPSSSVAPMAPGWLSQPPLAPQPRSSFPVPNGPIPSEEEPIASYPKARVSYQDFKELVAEVELHRKERVLSFEQFLEMSKNPNTIILDTRSAFRYDRIHLKGAKHLSFTDFTQANLAEVIPSKDTIVLIYCNNNFDGNQVDFASKSGPPRRRRNNAIESQVAGQAKPVQLALNIPTYINLYGYGYQNVYELGELVNVRDQRAEFEGTIVEPKIVEPKVIEPQVVEPKNE